MGTLMAVVLLAAVTGASTHSSSGRKDARQEVAATGSASSGAGGASQASTQAATQSSTQASTAGGGSTTAAASAGTAGGRPGTTIADSGDPAGDVGPGPHRDDAAPPSEEDDSATAPESPAAGTATLGLTATPSDDTPSETGASPTTRPTPPTDPADPPSPASNLTRLPAVEDEVLALTNGDRSDHGVAALSRDGCLDAEASAWAWAMANSAVMSHSPSGGESVQGCRGSDAYWGDNIGHWQPCYASAMEEWWMASPSHRPHILDPNFDAVGIGVWVAPSGRCWFQVFFGS
ncbi:MAG TPA: CAP domain-containing protein [Acidimicrobiales bacterium]|nr:CAP domain-containing protein [Acidimicrobiales bacterium]